jgi:hypothetical protein
MYICIGPERGEHGEALRQFYAVRYSDIALDKLPWGEAEFDCMIFACDRALARRLAEDVAYDIVQCNVDWVETTGEDAERMHDLIDVASVKSGRQGMVGDGNPMTAWHEEALTIPQMADVATCCAGGTDYVLVLVIGGEAHLAAAVEEVRRALHASR